MARDVSLYQVNQTLAPYIDAPVECDGFVRIASTLLLRAGVQHRVMAGSVFFNGCRCRNGCVPLVANIPLHCWIELEDGTYIDYRARMWFGDKDCVAHGVFSPGALPSLSYVGQPVIFAPLPDWLISVLCTPIGQP